MLQALVKKNCVERMIIQIRSGKSETQNLIFDAVISCETFVPDSCNRNGSAFGTAATLTRTNSASMHILSNRRRTVCLYFNTFIEKFEVASSVQNKTGNSTTFDEYGEDQAW